MNIDQAHKFIRENNPLPYYRVTMHHAELFGCNTPCNMFQIMYLLGSETNYDNFEKVELDEKYLSYIPLKYFPVNTEKGTRITDAMNKNYPWYKLAMSIISEGLRIPLVVQTFNGHDMVRVVEGKHRIGAIGMIRPYDPEYKVKSLAVTLDPIYTAKMFKQPHLDPAIPEGFRKMESR